MAIECCTKCSSEIPVIQGAYYFHDKPYCRECSRKHPRCRDCGGVLDTFNEPIRDGYCDRCDEKRGIIRSMCPQCKSVSHTEAGIVICLGCGKYYVPFVEKVSSVN